MQFQSAKQQALPQQTQFENAILNAIRYKNNYFMGAKELPDPSVLNVDNRGNECSIRTHKRQRHINADSAKHRHRRTEASTHGIKLQLQDTA